MEIKGGRRRKTCRERRGRILLHYTLASKCSLHVYAALQEPVRFPHCITHIELSPTFPSFRICSYELCVCAKERRRPSLSLWVGRGPRDPQLTTTLRERVCVVSMLLLLLWRERDNSRQTPSRPPPFSIVWTRVCVLGTVGTSPVHSTRTSYRVEM